MISYFFSDEKHFLWPSERDGYMHLYRYRLDGTLVNQVTKAAGRWRVPAAWRSGCGRRWWVSMKRMIGFIHGARTLLD
jgi:hypothetical protein